MGSRSDRPVVGGPRGTIWRTLDRTTHAAGPVGARVLDRRAGPSSGRHLRGRRAREVQRHGRLLAREDLGEFDPGDGFLIGRNRPATISGNDAAMAHRPPPTLIVCRGRLNIAPDLSAALDGEDEGSRPRRSPGAGVGPGVGSRTQPESRRDRGADAGRCGIDDMSTSTFPGTKSRSTRFGLPADRYARRDIRHVGPRVQAAHAGGQRQGAKGQLRAIVR